MDRFLYLPEQKVLICRLCAYAVPPTHLRTHLKGHRNQIPGLEGAGAITALEQKLREFSLVDPSQGIVKFPSLDAIALPSLLVQEGLQCKKCGYIVCSKAWMQQHIQSHQPAKRARGRPRKTAESITRAQTCHGVNPGLHCCLTAPARDCYFVYIPDLPCTVVALRATSCLCTCLIA